MDFAHAGSEMTREQEMISTKKRLDTFQFCRTSGPNVATPLSGSSSIGRPHSRHCSVSSVSLSTSNSTNSLLTTSEQQPLPSSDSRPSSLVGRPRPISHHRRRSSVSTRAESAEIMGVTLPEIPVSSSDDNINFGDKDSVRRRALQALEGRDALSAPNNTVEIPDFNSQCVPQKPSDRELKLPSGLSAFGISALSAKRDSFGKYLSSTNSIKDQLHTLMEEEEEEEEVGNDLQDKEASGTSENSRSTSQSKAAGQNPAQSDGCVNNPSRDSDMSDLPISPPSISVRHKPANLTLRPLSLISNSSNLSLPTPSLTPNARAGLRSFSLLPYSDSNTSNSGDGSRSNQVCNQKADLHSHSSSSSSSTSAQFQSPLGNSSVTSISRSPKRQSSISYIRSAQPQSTSFTLASLPTPGATPTSERRQSASSSGSFGSIGGQERRNMSEDMFVHQSHASLLARIAELERALEARPRSRPVSIQSDNSTNVSEASPSDEMLQLVADLKAERDELIRDIEGWRQRVHDLEHAKALLCHEKAVLERQLEAEKREAWLKSEKIGLLEMEKSMLRRQLQMKEEDVCTLGRRLESMQARLRQALLECDSLKEDAQIAKRQLAEAQLLVEARKETEAELVKVREALAAEHVYRGKLIGQLDTAGLLETPRIADKLSNGVSVRLTSSNQSRNNGFGFQSVDSACTTVEADEDSQQALRAPFTLKAVEEESEPHDDCREDQDELARYEDEDDIDLNIMSPARSFSSYESGDESPRSVSHLRFEASTTPVPSGNDALASRSSSSTPSPTPSPCPTPIPSLGSKVTNTEHVRRSSLSKAWTFPRGGHSLSIKPMTEEVDRFFGCLEDFDGSSPIGTHSSMDSKNLFSQRLQFADVEDEDLPPFVLPVQKVDRGHDNRLLDVVLEEDDDQFQCQTPDGRRKTSFPLSVSEDSSSRMSSPLFEDDVHSNSVPFVFPQMKTPQKESAALTALYRKALSHTVHSNQNSAAMVIDTTSPRACVTPKSPSTRTFPPSRIPPPSPPRFIQAKSTGLRGTSSPPKQKPAPSQTSGCQTSPFSQPRSSRGANGSPQRIRLSPSQPLHGSTLIPQLKSTSSSESQELALDRSKVKHGENVTSTSQPLLQSFTSFLPLPSLSWMTKRSQASTTDTTEQAYVTKERQLSKLRANMAGHRSGIKHSEGIGRCGRCTSELISL